MNEYHFKVSLDVSPSTGKLAAAYYQLREGKSARTVELAEGDAFADYDAKGRLLGLELLAPCPFVAFAKLLKAEPKAKRFVRDNLPRQFALAETTP